MTNPSPKKVGLEGEPQISPEAAKQWVLGFQGVQEQDGKLVKPNEPSTLCEAGILIASGSRARQLSVAHKEVLQKRAEETDCTAGTTTIEYVGASRFSSKYYQILGNTIAKCFPEPLEDQIVIQTA